MTSPSTLEAREIVGKIGSSPWSGRHRESIISDIAQAIEAAKKAGRDEEREACAKIAENFCPHGPEFQGAKCREHQIAERIRQRREE